jgi:hypothetical protein
MYAVSGSIVEGRRAGVTVEVGGEHVDRSSGGQLQGLGCCRQLDVEPDNVGTTGEGPVHRSDSRVALEPYSDHLIDPNTRLRRL